MQDYKSLCAAVTNCATLVNIQAHTAFWPVYMNSSASWVKNNNDDVDCGCCSQWINLKCEQRSRLPRPLMPRRFRRVNIIMSEVISEGHWDFSNQSQIVVDARLPETIEMYRDAVRPRRRPPSRTLRQAVSPSLNGRSCWMLLTRSDLVMPRMKQMYAPQQQTSIVRVVSRFMGHTVTVNLLTEAEKWGHTTHWIRIYIVLHSRSYPSRFVQRYSMPTTYHFARAYQRLLVIFPL